MASMQVSLERTIDQHYRNLDDIEFRLGGRSTWSEMMLLEHRMRRHMRRVRKYTHFKAHSRMRWFETSMFRRYRLGYDFMEIDMDLSDKIALELAQQQQEHQRCPNREGQKDDVSKALDKGKMRLDSMTFSDEGLLDDNDDDDGHNDLELHLVVDNLLPLVKHIVEFGKQCDRLHRMTARRDSNNTVGDLTFEVFAALARLAISINKWHSEQDDDREDRATANSLLAETVRLLGTVRLPHIRKLATTASKQLSGLHDEDDNNDKSKFLASSETGESSSDGNNETPPLHELSVLVRAEMAPVLEQLRADMSVDIQNLQDAILKELNCRLKPQDEVAEVSSLPPERKGWSSRLGWSRS